MKVFFDMVQEFFHQGGPVLYWIFAATALMWFFILERLFYFQFEFSSDLNKKLSRWNMRKEKSSWSMRQIRQMELSRLSGLLSKNISYIKTLVAVSPLLGLLGTVYGMISLFEVMAEFGTGNARMMASGISMATIPTMTGLVSALTGFYFVNYLENHSKKKAITAAQNFSF